VGRLGGKKSLHGMAFNGGHFEVLWYPYLYD
jgi:hypothetical protein